MRKTGKNKKKRKERKNEWMIKNEGHHERKKDVYKQQIVRPKERNKGGW